jgi:outer membrane cobalamin receptor
MIRRGLLSFLLLSATGTLALSHSSFGHIRGVVRDPQQRTVKDAQITLKARQSALVLSARTDDSGAFAIQGIPIGEYTLSVEAAGFSKVEQAVTITSGDSAVLQLQLQVAPVTERVDIVESPGVVESDSPTPTTLVNRLEIARSPGADRSNSLAAITDYVPGAYTTHDQLHVRGGHQVSWLIDGIPVPNTNIAANVGPQFDPKDVDYLEVQRGGYSAEYGDRTYGVFNVVPRTGWERHNEGEALISYGNFNQTNDQVSFGSHSDKMAYYFSLNGNRSDFGLSAPTRDVIHDAENGFGGFASLVFVPSAANQFRLVTSGRTDHYQVPNDADAQAAGIRDVEKEADYFANFSWLRTLGKDRLLTISPFYHFNRANFEGGPGDTPLISQEKRDSHYAGAQIALSILTSKHDLRGGIYGFFQHDSAFFGLRATDGSGLSLSQNEKVEGNQSALFLEDQYKLTRWLTVTAGLRLTHFAGSVSENAASPRVGAAVRVPRVKVVLHGFYGRYYQAPPLSTVSGPLIDVALNQGFGFLPLHGERDEEWQAGASLPLKGWVVDAGYFHTAAKNFFDHNAIGNSNIFFPLTIDRAHIRGFELTLKSPRLWQRIQLHAAYSHQRAEGQGAITGGLTDFSPPANTFFLDHDQRHTLNAGGDVDLPVRIFAAAMIHYGSGFVDSGGPAHLPGHTTFDLSFGKSFGERWSAAVHLVNAADNRFLLDNSLTFGGTHFVDPRQIYGEVRYRFHY